MPTVKHSSLCVRSSKKTSKPVLLTKAFHNFTLQNALEELF